MNIKEVKKLWKELEEIPVGSNDRIERAFYL